jgi:hypothetical protein
MLLFDTDKKLKRRSVRFIDRDLIDWLEFLNAVDWKYQYKITEISFCCQLSLDLELRKTFQTLPAKDLEALGFVPLYSNPKEITIVCDRAYNIFKKRKNLRLDLYCSTGLVALDYSSQFSQAIYERIKN